MGLRRSSVSRRVLDRILAIAALVVLLLFGEYLLFVLLAMAYGGTLSGAGGSAERFGLLMILLAFFNVFAAVGIDAKLRGEPTT